MLSLFVFVTHRTLGPTQCREGGLLQRFVPAVGETGRGVRNNSNVMSFRNNKLWRVAFVVLLFFAPSIIKSNIQPTVRLPAFVSVRVCMAIYYIQYTLSKCSFKNKLNLHFPLHLQLTLLSQAFDK